METTWSQTLRRATWLPLISTIYRMLGLAISRISPAAHVPRSTEVQLRPRSVANNADLEILVPDIYHASSPSSSSQARSDRLLKTHLSLYAAAKYQRGDALTKTARHDVKSISHLLPTLPSDELLSAGAAWLALLHIITDAVAVSLTIRSHAHAHALLDRCVAVFEAALAGRRKSLFPTDPRPVPVLLAEPLLHAFVAHVRRLLARELFVEFLIAGVKHWQAVKRAVGARERGAMGEDEYLELRRETVGVGPLFTLILQHHGCGSGPVGQRKVFHLMVREARLGMGLQVDLVGVKRGVLDEEMMNFMLVVGDRSAEMVAERGERAVELHDEAMQRVKECWETIQREGDQNAKACGDSLVTFVQQHFVWVDGAERQKI